MSNLAVLVSGRGSNLQALIDAKHNIFPAEIKVVICNKYKAPAIEKAQQANIPVSIVPSSYLESTGLDILKQYQIDWIILAGFMKILSPAFIAAYQNRIMNIHPSLLPAFPGLHAQRQALDCGVKIAGCTTHLVTEEVDAGPILGQRAVPVLPDDTSDTLSQRILQQEHKLLVETVIKYCQ